MITTAQPYNLTRSQYRELRTIVSPGLADCLDWALSYWNCLSWDDLLDSWEYDHSRNRTNLNIADYITSRAIETEYCRQNDC